MKRIIAVLAVVGLGLTGFAGTCNLLNMSLNTIGNTDTYGGQLQNNTGTNFLAHSFKVTFTDINGNVVDTQSAVPGCLRSWQNGASDFFSVASAQSSSVTASAIASLDLGQPFVPGNTVGGNATLSNVQAVRAGTALTVTGTIRNNDSVTTLASPVVCAVVYNSSGQVVVVQRSSLGDLGINTSANFTITATVPDNTSIVSHVDVWSDGFESGVPTTPLSFTGVGVSLGATHAVFTSQPTSATGGVAFPSQPVVTLEDTNFNVISSSSANVTLSITSGTGAAGSVLSCTSGTTVAAVNGVATFSGCSVNLASGTAYTLTASTPGASGTSSSFNITVGPAAKLAFSSEPPASTASGATFSSAPVVSVQDAGGNAVTGDTDSIQLSINSGPSGAALACSGAVPAVAGVATFAGCSLNMAGTYVLRAHDITAPSITDALSTSFSIT